MTKARKSEIGKLIHIPLPPNSKGRRYRSGRRMRICLDNERRMDLFTIPRHWKRLVEIIWKPTRKNIRFMILRLSDAMSRSSGSLVNTLAAILGANMLSRQQIVVTTVAIIAVFLNTSFTLEYFLAP